MRVCEREREWFCYQLSGNFLVNFDSTTLFKQNIYLIRPLICNSWYFESQNSETFELCDQWPSTVAGSHTSQLSKKRVLNVTEIHKFLWSGTPHLLLVTQVCPSFTAHILLTRTSKHESFGWIHVILLLFIIFYLLSKDALNVVPFTDVSRDRCRRCQHFHSFIITFEGHLYLCELRRERIK